MNKRNKTLKQIDECKEKISKDILNLILKFEEETSVEVGELVIHDFGWTKLDPKKHVSIKLKNPF